MDHHQIDHSLIVSVRPQKSTFFAGEQFECLIEFKSIKNQQQQQQQQQQQYHHSSISIAHTPSSSSSILSSTRSPSISAQPEQDYFQPSSSLLLPPRKRLIGPSSSSSTNPKPHPPLPSKLNLSAAQHLKSYPDPLLQNQHLPPTSEDNLDDHPTFSLLLHQSTPHSPLASAPSKLSTTSFEPFRHPSSSHHSHDPDSPYQPNPSRKLSTPSSGSSKQSTIEDYTLNPRRASLHAITGSNLTRSHHRSTGFVRLPQASILAWTYCQLEGYFEIQDRHINPDSFQSLRHPQTRGAGKLVEQDDDQALGGKSTSWMGWLFGLSNDRQSYSSTNSSHSNPSNRFPVFQNPISLLDVDVRLEAGQSRT